MATAPTRPRSTRRPLVRRHVDWPPTPEKLYDAITVPRGFRKELSLGRLRIGQPNRVVDQALLDLADQLATELPDGCRLDIYAGKIVVGGFPRLDHDAAVFELHKQLWPIAIQRGWMVTHHAVVIPHLREHKGADIMLVLPDPPTFDNAYCGEGVPLVVEVTSPGNADEDYGNKLKFYGRAGVAIYVIVDPERKAVVMRTKPYNSGYRDATTVPIGEPLVIPEPVEITIDTSVLPR